MRALGIQHASYYYYYYYYYYCHHCCCYSYNTIHHWNVQVRCHRLWKALERDILGATQYLELFLVAHRTPHMHPICTQSHNFAVYVYYLYMFSLGKAPKRL